MKLLKTTGSLAFLVFLSATLHAQEIFDAIKNNDSLKVKALVENDKSLVNSRDLVANSPLHIAAFRGYVFITKFLLSEGADLESKNNMGYTPLGNLCRSSGQIETARLLIDKGANITPYVGDIVTHDGKYLFFYNQWVSAQFIEEMRPKE
jgi:ankyrin repeat protein